MRPVFAASIKAVLCFFLLACALPSFSQKTTVDPNAGNAPKPVSDEVPDARLAQKVTYEGWHIPVKTILEDISGATGVTLLAGYNKIDWQVRDRRMNVFVKDVTLAQLMNSIARVMKFKWAKSEEGTQPIYRLCADRKLIASLQAEATKLERELKNEEVKRRTGLVDALAKVADTSGLDLQALRQTNPYLYMCAETGFAKLMTEVFTNEPRLREAFVNGDRTALVSASVFPTYTQQLCTDAIRKMWPLDHITSNKNPLSGTLDQNLPRGELHFSWLTNPAEGAQRKRLFYYGAQLASDTNDLHFLGDLRDPYAKSTQAWAKSCLDAVEQNMSPGEGWSKLTPGYWSVELEEAKEIERYLMFDDVVEHPDEPDLHREVTLKVTDEDKKVVSEELQALGSRAYSRLIYQLYQKAIAAGAEMNIVSDSYAVVVGGTSQQVPEKAELMVILDKLVDDYRCNWEKHGSVIELRRRDWFRRRASQLPDEWIASWRTELEKNGALSLKTYASIVVLSEDQIEENISPDQLLSQTIGACWDYGDKRELCRLYLQLSDTQRMQLNSEAGLDLRLLDSSQRKIYSDMFHYGWQRRWCGDEYSDAGSGKLRMKAAAYTNPDGSKSHKFTVCLARESAAVDEQDWVITLRKVVVPEKAGKTSSGK